MPKSYQFFNQLNVLQTALAAANIDTFDFGALESWAGESPARKKLIAAIQRQDVDGAIALVDAVAQELKTK